MFKRFLTMLLTVMLVLSLCTPLVLADEASVKVVDMDDSSMAEITGLAVSSAYSKSSKFTLRWGGADLAKTVSLPAKSDWSSGAFLEFWVYSSIKESSSFGLGIISDNEETAGLDYYGTTVSIMGKGWQLITLPLESFEKNGNPLGFDKVTGVELWPGYKGTSIKPTVDLYIDSMFVNVEQTVSDTQSGDMVLFDLTSQSGLAASMASFSSLNASLKKAPGKTTYAVNFTDNKATEGKIGAAGFNFNDMSVATTDFTPYNTIEFKMYNKVATGDSIRVAIRSDDYTNESNDYYYMDIVLDWDDEWRDVQLQLGSFSAGGVPLGWDQINAIQLWWYETSDYLNNSETYIEKITLKNIDYEVLWQEPQYIENIPPMEEGFYDFAEHIKNKYPNNQHPRLLATQEELDWMKENYKTDEYLNAIIPDFLATCNGAAEATTTSPNTAGGRAMDLALAYNLTGDQKYADACWQNWLVLTKGTSTWNPGGKSELSIGDISRSAAVSYDLMYNHWTEEQRMMARNAMILYALKFYWGNLLRNNGAATQDTNWNAIINSGVGMCALAIADTPGYEMVANQYLNRLHIALRILFRHYAPDGSPFEGLDYWNYCMTNYFAYEEALYNTLEDKELYFRFSILDEFGMENSSRAIVNMHGNGGISFNYYDGSPRFCSVVGDFLIGHVFDRNEDAGRIYEAKVKSTYSILMYRPEHKEEYKEWRHNMPLDVAYTEGEAQVGSMRASWDAGNTGFFVAYKGNNANVATHARLDTGTFVLESQGFRWASIINTANYNLPGMFGSQRYQYYRNRAEGMNTLVIGPGVDQGSAWEVDKQADGDDFVDQKHYNVSPIEKTASQPWASYAIVDQTDAYSKTASSARRGFALIDGRNAFLLQDEVSVIEPCEVYSFVHTAAKIDILKGGKEAILTNSKGDKQMKVVLKSNCNATLSEMEASALPTSPDVQNEANTGYRKLAVTANVSGSATFSLLFTPYYGEKSYTFTMDEIIPLNQWDTLLEEPVKLTGIYLDGVKLQGFAEDKTVYTLKEDRVGTLTATAGAGIKIEIEQAENVGDTAVVKATSGKMTTGYAVTFSSDAQEYLDNWSAYAPKGYIYSANAVEIPNMLDGSLSSGWSNEGPQWVGYDMGKPIPVSEVQLFWNNQNKRIETFDIQVSNDNKNWTTVWEGESILSDKMESYTFDEVYARYIKITGYKNTVNNWTSINEFYIPFSGTMFDDLEGSWAQSYIEEMAKIGMIDGVADRVYSPESTLSRAAFLTMLNRVYGVADGEYTGQIADIGAKSWFTPAIEGALAQDLIPPAMLEGGFKPDRNITREEICALAVVYYEKFHEALTGADLSKFTDADTTSEWARPYVEKAVAMRLIAGMSEDTFAPAATATRAQAATFLKRIYVKNY
ncbi:MAG: hypothetical protein E7403_00080 [Ruminococcaceae bacterium]|nr:hypothetical protein [Oscillospiraceae bacterium]